MSSAVAGSLAHARLDRLHSLTRHTCGRCRNWPSFGHGLPLGEHLPRDWRTVEVGSGKEQFVDNETANRLIDRRAVKDYELPS